MADLLLRISQKYHIIFIISKAKFRFRNEIIAI